MIECVIINQDEVSTHFLSMLSREGWTVSFEQGFLVIRREVNEDEVKG